MCVVKDELENLLTHKGKLVRFARSMISILWLRYFWQKSGNFILRQQNGSSKGIDTSTGRSHLFSTTSLCLLTPWPCQISEILELGKITELPWQIMPSNALSGQGLQEGRVFSPLATMLHLFRINSSHCTLLTHVPFVIFCVYVFIFFLE